MSASAWRAFAKALQEAQRLIPEGASPTYQRDITWMHTEAIAEATTREREDGIPRALLHPQGVGRLRCGHTIEAYRAAGSGSWCRVCLAELGRHGDPHPTTTTEETP